MTLIYVETTLFQDVCPREIVAADSLMLYYLFQLKYITAFHAEMTKSYFL